ncbi:SMI1/KNR4 family protein [Archangium primigenium]|uniref:SMI1/KNR4 family protein n=1 Tax=[Archangium] primigenium TaxID=2792470 RepID=UPI00195ED991|nr:SMI1/KNR4 family protein [Archangium primigenium]MBM7112623.1 SMI1/KNR4 family protein [Archangium primigenium]
MSLPARLEPNPERCTEEDLRALEQELGAELPRDYRDFLAACNGGAVEDGHSLEFDAESETHDVACFLGLSRDPRRYGLQRQYLTVRDDWDFPPSLLPIAVSVGPAKYYLGVGGPRHGKVLHHGQACLEKREADGVLQVEDFLVIAASFSAFMASLRCTRLDT